MDFSDNSTIHAPYSVINNTINNFPSSSKRASGMKRRSGEDAVFRRFLARRAVKSASFDAAERGDPPKCHPDTRIAVQDSLKAWCSNRTAGPLRLISGWAGTGKTTIAQTMAEYWAKRGQLAGSFFFSRLSEERSKADWVFATILHWFLQIFGVDVDIGHFDSMVVWNLLVKVLVSTSTSLPQPVVIVIDGLDETSITRDQVSLLRDILNSLDQLGSSVKVLISCRPERHLENVFNEFASKLGPSYRIQLGQSEGDKNDLRTFLRVSFDRICQDRRNDETMSITNGPWPSQEEIEDLVDRASGQFIFAATVVRFVDDENEDPVEMLNLVLEQRTSSFEAIDLLYIVILGRVGMTLDKSTKSLERRQLMQNLILHVNHQPSSSLAIADFWFEKEVTINILVKHLQALLVRNLDTHGQNSEIVIQFRHKSFHDFLARPSAPHSFSLAEVNQVSKFFFSLRMHVEKTAYRPGGRALQPSQWLGYTFLCCGDHPPAAFPYEEEARRLHQAYVRDRPTFRGCICLPQLEPIMIKMTIPIDHFIQEWKKQERLRTVSFPLLKSLLWLRVILYGLLSDPSTTLNGIRQALMSRPLPSLSWQARCLAVVNGLLCIAVLVNVRWDVVVVLYVFHAVATFLLRRFLRFDTLHI
ncbi:hypothetical protein BDN72DRAFT_848362 [Pluteus cervinus]|uniref:Uncharacterized protein n=1 Tax=Pluteus cervinus TaxID=181527 RepID=A0ACD3AAW7_9AGAR|nr:hypothetical protein BDN72DRAFT_848362 [Pluteus cervinus]